MIRLHDAPVRFAAGLALLVGILGLPSAVAAAAGASVASATVTVTDSGFTPASVTISPGGSVTWKNAGTTTHTAESVGGPAPFNTVGIGPGQSTSLAFSTPGIYGYTSGTDCLHGVYNQLFTCASYTIVVQQGAQPLTTAVPAAATPTPLSAASTGSDGNATVTITDSGFSPANVNIALNGAVTFTNTSANVHTATSTSDTNAALPPFDSGGIGPNQSKTIGFTTPGTYLYFSVPDCLSKSNPPGFACISYSITVGNVQAMQPQPAGPAGPTPTPVSIPGTAAQVTIDDVNGFQPSTVTIHAGETVGWVNQGTNTHSAVINQNPQPSQPVPWWLPYQLPSNGGTYFNTGGIGPGQTASFNFQNPGIYPYHSSTDPIYQRNNPNCSCTFITYQFFGTVVVTT